MRRNRLGFTFIELIVCISILMVLIGLLLPSLARAREAARATQSAVNLRTIGQVMANYSDSYAGWLPVGEVRRFYQVSADNTLFMSFDSHFDFGRTWPVLVHSTAPWEEFYHVWFSPGVRRPGRTQAATGQFSYRYSHSFLARPELWRLGAVGNDRLLTGVRDADVAFPANKVMAWDARMAYLLRPKLMETGDMLSNPAPMLFADSHVDFRTPKEATPPTRNVMNPDPAEGIQPLHNTPLGVHGRDY